MADSDKLIGIFPETGQPGLLPRIEFTGKDNKKVSLQTEDNNDLHFVNASGESLLKITTSGLIVASGGDSGKWNEAYSWGDHSSLGYALDSTVVKTTGDQTISGVKTFDNNGSFLSINNSGILISTDSNKDIKIEAGNSGGNGQLILGNDADDNIIRIFGGRVDFGGYIQIGLPGSSYSVGIGTSTPLAKLDVDGDILSEEINIVSAVSGATLFNIEGTNGNLFSVVDSTSGSLMSVNDITGLPAFEVFSDHSVVAGRFNANDFVISSGGNVGIGTASPSTKLDVSGVITATDGNSTQWNTAYGWGNHASAEYLSSSGGTITNNLTIGGNLTVNGDTVVANVSSMEIEDPILTLGLASGNIITDDNYDRGIAMVTNNGTAFMGWDNSADRFVLLSSGVASNSSGNYDAGIYGDLMLNTIYGSSGNAFIRFNSVGQNRIDINSDAASSKTIISTTELYLNSPQLYANATLSFPKNGTAISTATQKDSHLIRLYNSMWDGNAELQTDSMIQSIASTSVNTRSRLAFLTSNEDGTNNKVERLSILTNGNVGIGTATPDYKLQVYGSGNDALFGYADTGTAGGKVRIYVGNNDSNSQGLKVYVDKTSGTNFGINGTANGSGATANYGVYGYAGSATNNYALYGHAVGGTTNRGLWVDAGYGIFDDRVGIGTENPSCPLTVQLSSGTNNIILQSSGVTPNPLLQINTYPTLNRCQLVVGTYNAIGSPNYSFYDDPDTGIAGGFIADTLEFVAGGKRRSFIGSNFLALEYADSIAASGISSQRNSNDLTFRNSMWRTDTNAAYIDGSYIRSVASTSVAGDSRLGFYIARGYHSGGGQVERLSLLSNGNVGIGTVSPQALLHVNGQAYLQSLALTGGTADRILATDTNKNVVYLNTATYPSLTELSYVKGVTSAIQTQIDTKMPKFHAPSSNIDTIVNGITRVYPTGNGPDGTSSHITIFSAMQDDNNNYGFQIGTYSTSMFFRNKGATFNSWYKLWSASDFTSINVSNWNTAYGWGNHASAGYQSASTALTTSTTFGGDVSGAYNNIVVADDSHNHIIGNVDGLQSALDNKIQLGTSQIVTTAGNIPIWSDTTGTALDDGYSVSDNLSTTHSSAYIPRADAVKTYVDNLLSANDAMVYKGTIGTGGTVVALPTSYSAGWTYRVITAGTYAGKVCEVSDLIIAVVDRSGSGNLNSDWTVVQTNIDGAVVGPALATNGNFPVFNGTTGKLIANSSYGPSSFYLSTNPNGYTNNTGTVTSVSGTGTVAGLTLTGTVTTAGSLTLGGILSTPVSTINDSTTVGQNLVKLTNPSAVRFLRINANNTVDALTDSAFRTAIGAGTSSTNGTVTSVGLSLPNIFNVSNSPISSAGTLSAGFVTQESNTVFAGPSAGNGTPSFRALVAADIPTLNQNTTGTSAGVNTTVPAGSYANLVYATIGTNDYFRIRAGGAADAGDVEIATADNGNEPIYVRQYSGAFVTLTRTATLLDSSGNTTFPGSVTAGSFVKTLGVGESSTDLLQAGGGVITPGSLTVSSAGTAGSANQVANTLTRGSYLTGNNFNGSAATTWAVDAATANTVGKIVARDASGNFSAGTITAALSGNASTATTLQNSRTITIGSTGRSFNGSADITWTLADIGAQAALTNPVTGTGTNNYISKWTGTTSQGNSLIYDNGTNIGLGTSSPSGLLHINHARDVHADVIFKIRTTNFDNGAAWTDADLTFFERDGGTNSDFMHFKKTGSSIFRIDNSGRVGIGTSTPGTNLHVYAGASTQTPTNVNGLFVENNGTSNSNYVFQTATGSGKTFSITNAGYVGIGTTTPSDKLNVIGDISSGTTDTQGKFKAYGGFSQPNLLFEGFGADGTARISTNSYTNRQLKIENDGASTTLGVYIEGDVGIGTTTPAEKLEIDGSLKFANCTTRILRADGNSLKFAATSSALGHYGIFVDNTATSGGRNFRLASWADGTTGKFIIRDDSSGIDRLAIDANGNVGIGVTDPDEKLEVNGNIHLAANGLLYFGAIGTNTVLSDDNSSNRTYLLARNNTFDILNAAGSTWTTTLRTGIIAGGLSATANLVLKSTTGVGTTDYISLNVGNNGATEAVRIINNGNVGIGTTSPAELLTVYGDSKYLYIQAQNNSGSAGIKFGNTAPRQQIYIEGTSSDLVIDSINGGIGESIRVGYGTGAVTINESGSDLDFRVEGDTDANLLFVDASTDRVGIGTESPSYKLQVNGSFGATTKSFRIDHPSRPNYTLEYGSLESPYHGVRLTGRGKVVKGSGTVLLPSYLKDLIHDDENINIQITNIKHGKTVYVDEIDLNNDQFTVRVDRAKSLGDLEFFWVFTGVRKDVDNLVVEREK